LLLVPPQCDVCREEAQSRNSDDDDYGDNNCGDEQNPLMHNTIFLPWYKDATIPILGLAKIAVRYFECILLLFVGPAENTEYF
jgi:hypothetical protein